MEHVRRLPLRVVQSDNNMTNRTCFQASLGTLLAVAIVCAVAFAIVRSLGLEVVLGCSGLAFSSGFVLLLALLLIPFDSVVSRLRYFTLFAVTAILFYGLTFAFCLLDAAVNQPYPDIISSQEITNAWLARAVAGAALGALLPVSMLLLPVALHLEWRTIRPQDHGYYPRIVNVWRGLGLLRVRLILIVGGVLVFGYYAKTAIEVQSLQGVCGIVWPGPRVWISCQLLWGLLWLADSTSRPDRGMVMVAIGYLCITILFLLLVGFRPMMGV